MGQLAVGTSSHDRAWCDREPLLLEHGQGCSFATELGGSELTHLV
jgi:hypothetical protein